MSDKIIGFLNQVYNFTFTQDIKEVRTDVKTELQNKMEREKRDVEAKEIENVFANILLTCTVD